MKAYQSKNQRVWIKSRKSGDVFVCPANLKLDPSKVTEEELRQHCLDDSLRPDNY